MIRFIVLCLLFNFNIAHADSSGTLQRALNKIRSMQASFVQTVSRHGRVTQRSTGMVRVYRPGRFRWDIRKPNQQIIVADGMKLWHYDIALKQVTVSRLSQLHGTASLFLSSSLHGLGRYYRVKQKGNTYYLESTKKGSDFHRVEILIKNQKLLRIIVRDSLGNTSDLQFNAVKINIPISQRLFEFSPPRGVDVIS